MKRDAKPTAGSRVCSCHFRDGKKENLPAIFQRNAKKIFQPHHLSPEINKTRKTNPVAKVVSETHAAEVEEFQGLAESMEVTASISTATEAEEITPGTSTRDINSSVMLDSVT